VNDRVTLSSSDDTEGLADDLRDELRARGLPAAVRHVRTPEPGTLGAAGYVELVLAGIGAAKAVPALAAALAGRLKRPDFRLDLREGDRELHLTARDATEAARLREILTDFFDPPRDQP
jgi:membrane-associated two-gene conflict system component 1 (EACC1)